MGIKAIQWVILGLSILVSSVGCDSAISTVHLNKNVKLEKVSAQAPAKDEVIVVVTVSNKNDYPGKAKIGAEVNCGAVSWREKQETLYIEANSKSTARVTFKRVKDRIPMMAKEFEYQVRLYGSGKKVLDKTEKRKGRKPYGR